MWKLKKLIIFFDFWNFRKFVAIIHDEQDGAHIAMQQIVAGEKPPARRKGYI